MTKRRAFLAIIIGLIMTLCISFAVACGGGEEDKGGGTNTATIKWTIPDEEHVTVTVDGSTELPTTYEVGKALVFKATPSQGYEVSVSVGRQTLTERNGSYTYTIKAGTTNITVAATRKVRSVAVTKNPATMTYFAGEEVDTTGMEVQVTYETNESEAVKNYSISYTEGNPYFVLGDTSFTVSYSGKTVTVNLEKAVVGKITVDPAGGEIEPAYEIQLKAMGIKDVAKDSKGVYTFTFDKPLAENIPLPTNGQLSRGTDNEYTIVGMQENGTTAKNVPANTDLSHTYTAAWRATLVDFTSVKYEQNEAGTPYLVLKGTFKAATSVKLIFHEGNQNVTIDCGSDEGEKGEAFEIRVDMDALAKKDDGAYQGMWLDVVLVSVNEDGSVGEDRQEISFNASYVTKDALVVGDISCTFAEYAGMLKAVVSGYVDLGDQESVEVQITLSGAFKDGAPILTIDGSVNKAYSGKTVRIDYEIGSTKTPTDAKVASDGKFKIEIDMNKVGLNNIAYFHFYLLDTNGSEIYKGDSGNLLNSWLRNVIDDNFKDHGDKADSGAPNGYLLTDETLEIANESRTVCYYIGPGKWGGVIAYGENEAVTYTDIGVEKDAENKVYYTIGGTYNESLAKDDLVTLLKEEWKNGDISNNPDAGSMHSAWDVATFTAANVFNVEVVEAEHTFKIKLALPAGAGHGWILFIHTAASSNFYGKECELGEPVTVGTIEYRIERGAGFEGTKGWINDLPMLYITDTTKPQVSLKANSHVKLYVDDYAKATKVFYVVEVETKNTTVADLFFGNADTSNYYAADATLSSLDENGAGTLYFDITGYTGTQLWPHIYFKNAEGGYENFVEIRDSDPAVGAQYAIVNGRKYMIKNANDTTYYGDACVVTEATDETKNPPTADRNFTASKLTDNSITLALSENKVILTLEGNANTKYYAKEDVKLYLFNYVADTRMPVPQTITWAESGNFTITADLTDLPISAVSYYLRVYFAQFESYDVKNVNKETVTLDVETTKSYVLTLPIEGTAALRVMSYEEAHRTYAMTGAGIVDENGTVYFTISGTYSGYTVAEVKAVLTDIYFDLQQRGGQYTRYDSLNRTVVAADGEWMLKLDVSELAAGPYTAHFIYDGSLSGDARYKNLNVDPSVLVDGTNIKVGKRTYTITNRPGSSAAEDFWGAIGLTITIEMPKITITGVDLATDSDTEPTKAYYVVTVTVENGTKEELQKNLTYGDAPNTLFNVAKIEETDGGYKVYFDVTDAAKGSIWSHMYYSGANYSTETGDIKTVPGANGKSVTVGGKTYSIRNINDEKDPNNTWGMDNLVVS